VPTEMLPLQLTSFVGRTTELAEITALLADPDCRLLTLVGSGGIGKTRLALQVAEQAGQRFQDGVFLVSLQPTETREPLAAAIADALKVLLSDPGNLAQQILRLLREQNLLLVLDNFEHLLPEATFLSTLLQQCPYVKVLATSREVLNLQEEWLYPVHGLPVPPDGGGNLESYDAVRLFVDRARARRANFSPADEYPVIGRICRMVEGMPLAIELAASWIRDMNCAVIAAEIERNMSFLSTRLRNVPERHRSLQAVFDQTWTLLSSGEQETFMALSVFVDGFGWEAAQDVTGGSLATVTSMADKSLLRVDDQGRYHLHNLLRQYAHQRLGIDSEQEIEVRERHCDYYMKFVQARNDAIVGPLQRESVKEIAAELENVRAAWQWAVARNRLANVRETCLILQSFFDFQSRFREAYETFQGAVDHLDRVPVDGDRSLTLAALLAVFG
jgi:predicted ATPase